MEKCISADQSLFVAQRSKAQIAKKREYKGNDENVFYIGRTEIQSNGSVSFDWTGI